MAKKKIYKHHQRASFADAKTDAQARELVLGGTLRKVGVKFADGYCADLTPMVDADAFGSLSAAITAISTTSVKLAINSTQTIASNLTIPSNITLVPCRDAFSVNSGITLTLNECGFQGGLERYFIGAGTIAGKIRVSEIYPEWWGAVGNNIADDSTPIQTCLTYVSTAWSGLGDGGSPQVVLTQRYKCNTGLVVPIRVDMVGKSHVAGNVTHNTTLLNFRDIAAGGRAITLSQDSMLKGLDIQGDSSTGGTPIVGGYGIYGGEVYQEGFGIHNTILECTIAGFETNILLSGWLNTIDKCDIGPGKYGIRLQHAANHTIIKNCIIENGSNADRIGIYCAFSVDRGGEGIYITNCDIESVWLGIVIEAGEGIVIKDNRFEICNAGFIEVRGRNAASDDEISVVIKNNWMTDYGANASGSSRFGIKVSAGKVVIDDNDISRYDSGTNVGLSVGITFGTTGVLHRCLIGRNNIQAYSAFPNYAIATSLRQKVQSRFFRQIEYLWDLADDPGNNIEHFFRFVNPIGYTSRYSIRSFCAFNIDAITDASNAEVAIGEINIGYREATPDLTAYMDNFELTNSSQNTSTYATDTELTPTGETFFGVSDARAYLIRMEPGLAVSGRTLLTLVIDEFQY
jgi:hypothetical protein